ncbi:MAG: TetR family transcriptional regulator [Candidatus Dormibacteraeota bacterium]|nr:TetR family transcriptional regulator [Candidatus Dormibacteraeota bacterium]
MGNREDLLEAAKRCLYERGYARTTARDIAAAAGTSLAAIGYHYRSTEALLNAALFAAIGDWGRELEEALAGARAGKPGSLERFEQFWVGVLESFATQRPIWSATFEVMAQADHVPGIKRSIADGLQEGRMAWAALLQGVDPAREEATAHAVGSLYQALLSGVLVQWAVDPERAPTAAELTLALRAIASGLEPTAAGAPMG